MQENLADAHKLLKSVTCNKDKVIQKLENERDEESKRGDRRVKEAKERAENSHKDAIKLLTCQYQQGISSTSRTQHTNPAIAFVKNENVRNALNEKVKNENIESV